MKFVKSISLFFLYPLLMFGIGFCTGVWGYHYFYPGKNVQMQDETPHVVTKQKESPVKGAQEVKQEIVDKNVAETGKENGVLNKDTEYILQEVDADSGNMVEYTYHLPEKYLGMNRESFVGAMEAYEASPPLKEVERGFIGLEVVSFSAQRVVVQMNYAFVKPTDNFYICVEENYVVVYLEDKETVYMQTDILLETLPENLQYQIMNYMYVKGEEDLYHFLESYSS